MTDLRPATITPLRNRLIYKLFRAHRKQWILAKMKVWHPWQLKKSKSWGPFLLYVWGEYCLNKRSAVELRFKKDFGNDQNLS